MANTVDFEGHSGDQARGVVKRMLQRFSDILTRELPTEFRFEVKHPEFDSTPERARNAIYDRAKKAARDSELFLFYYYGHGDLDRNYELNFVFPGTSKGTVEYALLGTLEGLVKEADSHRTLFVLDCCYAGAREERPTSTPIRGQYCRLASTTSSAKAYISTGREEDPIGYFTGAVLDGLLSPDAREPLSDKITAKSLFKYARQRTQKKTNDLQVPTIIGDLSDAITEYQGAPPTVEGIAEDTNDKTAYKKLLAIILTLRRHSGARDSEHLLSLLKSSFRDSFLTLHRQRDGTFKYLFVKPAVVQRYVRFLRKLHLVLPDSLELSPGGRRMADRAARHFSQDLLEAVDGYLTRHGLSRLQLLRAPQDILQYRGVPSQQAIIDLLSLTGGRAPRDELGVVLTILAAVRALRASENRAFFSW